MTPFPESVRKEAGKKRGWKCEYVGCTRTFAQGYLMECHHELPTSNFGTDDISNLLIVCVEHHAILHEQLTEAGFGHPESAKIVRARLQKTGGRWKK